jgi:Putative zinc-finger
MTMNRHDAWDELISASLHGDLSADEQLRLDTHLDTCATCRATLEAFSVDRRMLSGLRHVSPPRDLGARVRTGIEMANVPWWRRPATIFTAVGGSLAAVAGALLAVVMLNGTADDPQVGQPTDSPTPLVQPSVTPQATLPPQGTPAPTAGPSDTPAPSMTAAPTEPPIATSPEPDVIVAVTGPPDNQSLIVTDGTTSETVSQPSTPPGPPVAAELSPESAWLALINEGSFSGINSIAAARIGESITPEGPGASPVPEPPTEIGGGVDLGQSVAGSPFLERMTWTPDGALLAYTLANPEGGGTDVWIFRPETSDVWALTAVGDAYAASWVHDDTNSDAPPRLWVSTAEGTVASHLVEVLDGSGQPVEAIDPAETAIVSVDEVFQPILSPNGSFAIFWKGVMVRSGEEWVFEEGGAPYLSEFTLDEAVDDAPFPSDRPVFTDLTIDRDAFRSAGISWGLDSDAYAVWGIDWAGASQSADPSNPYPDPARVYFGRATNPQGLTIQSALDRADLPADWRVVDVKVAPTGRHLLVTVARPLAGELDTPTAQLLLITRNLGDVADEVEVLCSEDGEWCGPAAFDAYVETEDGTEAP